MYIEEWIKVRESQERRRKQLLDNVNQTIEYWKLNEKTLRRSRPGRVYGPVIRQTTILVIATDRDSRTYVQPH
jgi:hypothetical protein